MNTKLKIMNSIDLAKRAGYTLIKEDWGDLSAMCVCVMGCVIWAEGMNFTDHIPDNVIAASKILNVSTEWIDSFIDGFDGNGTALNAQNSAAWIMGEEVCFQTEPISSSEFWTQKMGAHHAS